MRGISLSTENFVYFNRNAILACNIWRSFAYHSSKILISKVDKFYTGLLMIIQKNIIFVITQIHRVRSVSVSGETSRVKPSKKIFFLKLEKFFWNFWKKIFGYLVIKSDLGIITKPKKNLFYLIFNNIFPSRIFSGCLN